MAVPLKEKQSYVQRLLHPPPKVRDVSHFSKSGHLMNKEQVLKGLGNKQTYEVISLVIGTLNLFQMAMTTFSTYDHITFTFHKLSLSGLVPNLYEISKSYLTI